MRLKRPTVPPKKMAGFRVAPEIWEKFVNHAYKKGINASKLLEALVLKELKKSVEKY